MTRLALIVLLAVNSARAQAPDGDWPCVQPLVGSLASQAYWGDALPENAAHWREDSTIAALVAAIVPRQVPIESAERALESFADAVPVTQRGATLPAVFAGLLDETNEARGVIVQRLRALARRQRDVAGNVTRLATETASATGDAESELAERRDFATRMFQETQRTMRYACEAPVELDARLGRFARVLRDRLR